MTTIATSHKDKRECMYVPNVVTETFCEIFSLLKFGFYTNLDTFHEKPLNKQHKTL